MIQHYLTVALRNLLKNKGQTLISVTGLAVGLFCFALCTYLLRYWMNEDNEFNNKKRIAEIVLVQDDGHLVSGTPAFLGVDIRNKQFPIIECITRATYNNPENLSFEISESKTLPYQLYVMETDTNFITVFDRHLVCGDISAINKQPNTLLLSQSAAKRIYGGENPVGKKVIGQDQKAYTIGGVFENFPANNSISPYEPIEALTLSVLDGFLEQQIEERTGCNTYALTLPNFKPDDLDKQLRNLNLRVLLFDKNPSLVRAFQLGHTKYKNIGYALFYGFIFLIGLLIFLSSLLNYYSFITGNFYNRTKEFSIRKGIGEDKKHLFFLLFTESCLSLFFTTIFALCLVELLTPGFQFSFFRIKVDFDSLSLSGQIVEYLLGCIILSAIICGIVCLRLDRISLIEGIRFSQHRVRNTLLGIQYFIALFFLSGAAIATLQTRAGEQQLFSSLNNDEKERIFFVRTDYQYMESTYPVLLSKWKANSMIEDILEVHDKLPNTRINSYTWENGEKQTLGGILYASANVGSFLHLKPIAGSLLLDEQSLLINETFMNAIKENPVNKIVRINNAPKEYKINGVTSSLIRFVDGSEYFASLAIGLLQKQGNCYVRLQPGKEKEGKAYLEQTVKEFLPESIQPEIHTLKDECTRIQTTERMLRNVFTFFATVCLIITLLGIYAAISQDTERRQKEVAIRKINGASLKNISYLFMKFYLGLLLIATLFVFPLMWMITDEMLKNWIIRFNYNNPLFWLGIFFVITIFTAVVILVKILRTARINPADVIKAE